MKGEPKPTTSVRIQEGASIPRMELINNGASVPRMQQVTIERGASVPILQQSTQTQQSASNSSQLGETGSK